MITLSQLANTNFLLLYCLIFLPLSTLSIIIFFYLASLQTLLSPVPHFLYLILSFQSLSVCFHSISPLSFCSHLHWHPSGFSPSSTSLLSIHYASHLPFFKLPWFVSPLC